MPMRASVVVAVFGVFVGGASRRAEATAILAPTVIVEVGDVFTIPISIDDAIDLVAWQFDLTFDPTIVRAESMAEGPFLASQGATLFTPPLIIDNSIGLISGAAGFFVDVPPLPSGDGVLANIEFTALAPGVSALSLSSVFLNLSASGFVITPGQVTVVEPAIVAEPATVSLLLGGLVALRLARAAHLKRSNT
jgi:Cohesin domain